MTSTGSRPGDPACRFASALHGFDHASNSVGGTFERRIQRANRCTQDRDRPVDDDKGRSHLTFSMLSPACTPAVAG